MNREENIIGKLTTVWQHDREADPSRGEYDRAEKQIRKKKEISEIAKKKKKEEEPNKQSTFVGGKEPGAGAADDMET